MRYQEKYHATSVSVMKHQEMYHATSVPVIGQEKYHTTSVSVMRHQEIHRTVSGEVVSNFTTFKVGVLFERVGIGLSNYFRNCFKIAPTFLDEINSIETRRYSATFF